MYIPNFLIHTCIEDAKDINIINIMVILVYTLLEIAPDVYGPHVITDRKGVKKLIVQCQNSIYGAMMTSILYYKKFRNII